MRLGIVNAGPERRGAINQIDRQVWVQPLGGGPPKQLTRFQGDQIFAFDWSRDGRQLVCLRGVLRQDLVLIRNFK